MVGIRPLLRRWERRNNIRPALTCGYYAYWGGVSPHMAAIHPLPRRVVITFPTNDALTITYVAFPRDEFEEVRSDPERHLMAALRLVTALEEPFREATRVERIRGTGDLRNFFRPAYGDGWALVGDAGYHKDPIIAQGISDAFRSAEWLAEAIHAGFSGARPIHDALADYRRVRDEQLAPMYELSCSLATLEPPSAEMFALYEALRTDATERNRFFGTLGGAVSPSEYYAPDNLQRIISNASA
jgi:flavin-dependent dehydrogenase